jgi:hypothetical protein
MTISPEERERLVAEPEDTVEPPVRYERSPIVASLMGMLAGLGLLTLISAALAAGGLLLNLEVGFVITEAGVQEMSAIGLAVAAIVILASTLIGGFVAGRIARWGGPAVGIGSSLWFALVVALLTGLGIWAGNATNALDGLDLADPFAGIATADLTTAAAIAGGGLFVLAVLGGLLGGRFGQTDDNRPSGTVVDLRDVDQDQDRETTPEDSRTSV